MGERAGWNVEKRKDGPDFRASRHRLHPRNSASAFPKALRPVNKRVEGAHDWLEVAGCGPASLRNRYILVFEYYRDDGRSS